jgi:hypothetical protein
MFTLVYLNDNLNRPDTLSSFLKSNVGESPLLQIDCITPFQGSAEELVEIVCEHLNSIDPHVKVAYNIVQNVSTETTMMKHLVNYIVVQVQISNRNL